MAELPRRNQSPTADELAHHLAAFSLFQDRAKPLAIPQFQRFPPAVQFGCVESPELHRVDGGFSVGSGLIYRNRGVQACAGYKPAYEYNFVKPTQQQVQKLEMMNRVERFVEGRDRILQRQQNRVIPVQGRIRVGIGGFGRESGGTGVFLPRIVNPSIANTSFRKKQGPRNRRETQVAQQRHAVKRVVADKLEEQYCQFSTSQEMVLPQDWTY